MAQERNDRKRGGLSNALFFEQDTKARGAKMRDIREFIAECGKHCQAAAACGERVEERCSSRCPRPCRAHLLTAVRF